MRALRFLSLILALAAIALAPPPSATAQAQGVGPDADQGGATVDNQANAKDEEKDKKKGDDFGDHCRPGIPIVDDIAEGACDVGKAAIDDVTGAGGRWGRRGGRGGGGPGERSPRALPRAH